MALESGTVHLVINTSSLSHAKVHKQAEIFENLLLGHSRNRADFDVALVSKPAVSPIYPPSLRFCAVAPKLLSGSGETPRCDLVASLQP
jgi:hypothetical protein